MDIRVHFQHTKTLSQLQRKTVESRLRTNANPFAMQPNYPSHLLGVSVAQVCLTIGWEKANPSALHCLISLLERYVRQLAHLAVRAAELSNRTEPNMDDMAFAFHYLRIDMDQMAEYYRMVPANPLPYVVPLVTIPNRTGSFLLPSFSLSLKELKRKRHVLQAKGHGKKGKIESKSKQKRPT